MKTTIALTAVGRDRPGIVAAVSEILYQTGCNIEDSSMCILQGEFAMILIISLADSMEVKSLDEKLGTLRKSLGLSISLRELAQEELSRNIPKDEQVYIISVYGTDKPGIVYKVTQSLAGKNINITDVNTKVAGEKDKPVYVMLLEVELPEGTSSDEIEKSLGEIAKELEVEINIKPLETAEL
ncbi:MAG: ACT domain-containing protein [bacterium]